MRTATLVVALSSQSLLILQFFPWFFFDRFFGAGCWDAGHLSGGCRVSLGAPCEALECREHQGTVEPRLGGLEARR